MNGNPAGCFCDHAECLNAGNQRIDGELDGVHVEADILLSVDGADDEDDEIAGKGGKCRTVGTERCRNEQQIEEDVDDSTDHGGNK